ncbi:DUF6126 family protein [Streptacidiphilus sp. ASG 303]|uniref:DUF6126 family protein n=1 Tax=Streptacidiphilus sp. ASG 303 TaxID=2896847 RepID=UPI001E5DF0D3|nr:DUF6126 family protein [Streptacidiphilus sp. ASG 303]MCD0481475.1 DUF6126 family protein [Streptacidiphilus sp. ASG 303]
MTAETRPTPGAAGDPDRPARRRAYLRAFIYVGVVHLFAALLFVMFALGAR